MQLVSALTGAALALAAFAAAAEEPASGGFKGSRAIPDLIRKKFRTKKKSRR